MKLSLLVSFAFKPLVTCALLLIVFGSVNRLAVREELSLIQGGRLSFLVVICWFGQLFCAQRWRLLARPLDMPGSYLSFFQSLLHVPSDVALTIAVAFSALIIVSDLAGVFFLPLVPRELRRPPGEDGRPSNETL